MSVIVRKIGPNTVEVIQETMSAEILKGEVRLCGTKSEPAAEFKMADPVRYVGDLSNEFPEYRFILMKLTRRILKAMVRSPIAVD